MRLMRLALGSLAVLIVAAGCSATSAHTVIGDGCNDCIVEVNPKTGDLKKMIGPVGHTGVYGLAFWGGAAYGFDNAGELFEINLTTGASTSIPMPGAPSGLSFWGAGSTTSAPLKPPS
jgi:hypothetical protein